MKAQINDCFEIYCAQRPFAERCLESWQQFAAQHLRQPLTFYEHNYKELAQRNTRVELQLEMQIRAEDSPTGASIAKPLEASMRALALLLSQRGLRSQLRALLCWRAVTAHQRQTAKASFATAKLLRALTMGIMLRRRAQAHAAVATAWCVWSERVIELRAANERKQKQGHRQQDVSNAVKLLRGLCATADHKRCERALSAWRTASEAEQQAGLGSGSCNGSKLFTFGLLAVQQFTARLSEWPQYRTDLLLLADELAEQHPELAQSLEQALLIDVINGDTPVVTAAAAAAAATAAVEVAAVAEVSECAALQPVPVQSTSLQAVQQQRPRDVRAVVAASARAAAPPAAGAAPVVTKAAAVAAVVARFKAAQHDQNRRAPLQQQQQCVQAAVEQRRTAGLWRSGMPATATAAATASAADTAIAATAATCRAAASRRAVQAEHNTAAEATTAASVAEAASKSRPQLTHALRARRPGIKAGRRLQWQGGSLPTAAAVAAACSTTANAAAVAVGATVSSSTTERAGRSAQRTSASHVRGSSCATSHDGDATTVPAAAAATTATTAADRASDSINGRRALHFNGLGALSLAECRLLYQSVAEPHKHRVWYNAKAPSVRK
jgi:CCR4-NOT transcription complex subunit 1 TTP binding domain